jgi:hypothetical protein
MPEDHRIEGASAARRSGFTPARAVTPCGRGTEKTRKIKESLACRGLIGCGHSGCAGGDHHCTGYMGKCRAVNTGGSSLEKKFTELLKGISFSHEVLNWVTRR